MKHQSLAIVFLFLVAMFSIPNPQVSHATGGAVVQNTVNGSHNFNNACNACTIPVNLTVHGAGDLVVMGISFTNLASCANTNTLASVTDNKLDSYIEDISSVGLQHSGNTVCLNAYVYHTTAPSGVSSLLITVTMAGNPGGIFYGDVFAFDVTGAEVLVAGESGNGTTASSGCPCSLALSSALSWSDGAFLVAADSLQFGAAVTAGTGFTMVGPPTTVSYQGFEYATDSTVSSPSAFPQNSGASDTNRGWRVAAAVYGPSATVYLIIPCTWFQQQCWWYPTLFFGLYLGLFSLVAKMAETSKDGTTYLELTALNLAAIAQTAMGLLTFAVPLLLITLTVVYAVRFRNR